MIYLLTKALHLVALFVWIGGMVAVALALRRPVPSYLKQLKAYDRLVTSPAMVLAWTFGILLGVQGGWFSQSWLGIKVILVLLFSGLHGVLTGKLRRAATTKNEAEASGSIFLLIGFALVILIVLLVTLKP